MNDDPKPYADNPSFRMMVGLVAVVGSFAAFGGLFYVEIPARNENALMFAMGVVFSWGSSVFASEYGASNVGRKVAEGAIKRMDRLPAVIPVPHVPVDAQEAAQDTADAAQDRADTIKDQG